MDRRSLIREVLAGRRGTRIPRAIFGGGLWSYRRAGLQIEDLRSDPLDAADRIARIFEELDTDIIFTGSGLNTFPAEAIGGELLFRNEQAPLLAFPLIEKTDDMRQLQDIDIRQAPHALGLIDLIRRLRLLLPDRYLCTTSWGPFTWGMILCDWSLLKEKVATDREFIHEICELGLRLSLAFYQPLIEEGLIDAVSIPDGAVTLIPSDLYADIVLPAEYKLFAAVKQLGAGCFLHQCGNIGSQISLYPETGADCITVDTGVEIGAVYDEYKDRLVTAGNVDVINVIYGGTPDLIRAATVSCIDAVADPFRRYILMPSCDLPPDTDIANIRAFLSCADRTLRA